MNDEHDPGDEHREPPPIPMPRPDTFVRYGPGPADYFEPVNFRQPRDGGRIMRDGIHTWEEDW